MAFTPVQPIAVPTTNYSLSGPAQYVASGTVTSGTTAFPGPHMIETQTLNIDYIRVPKGIANNFQLTLSSASMNHAVTRTELLALVTAEYRKEKVYSTFSTSAYSQPQTFQILAMSSDPSGNNYGALTASSFGPMGTIATYQPYHYRRPWDDNVDTAVLQTCYGANFIVESEGSVAYSQPEYIGLYFSHFMRSNFAGSFADDSLPTLLQTVGDTYLLFGSYSPLQESIPKMINYINSIGNRVASTGLFKIPGEATGDPVVPYSTVGASNYSTNRHDYTQFF